ncbi:DNA replication terminus site-binding protein [Halomonas llamarensis]|uniref:DNA replication terminus site-binding protein n=1 Tax=Halomonas llamarensis TaxID=2945104 RepID=A0ABT0SMM1_9GAMM|nr:DNA replication terminus site-binding protein [Halomonas llamarensis]MCL7929050.1 DNA replication terminus site-binding protein [Halomonas llamarensis]
MPTSSSNDTLLPYQLQHRLDASFDAVLNALEGVVARFDEHAPAVWAFNNPMPDAAWLRRALFDMWHEEGQDGRETRNYIGLIAADEALIDAVMAANQAKNDVSECLKAIKAHAPTAMSSAKAQLPMRHPDVERVLEKTGLARLHLKQCWRHLPVAQAPVSRVRFAWYSSGRSIKRVTVQEAEKKLLALDTDAAHVRIQLRKLASIPSGEILAQVQTQAPLMRANLFFTEPLEDGHTRRALNVAMPIFVPSHDGRLPHSNMPPLTPPETRTRAKRRDEKLESEAFLPSLRVYRYR